MPKTHSRRSVKSPTRRRTRSSNTSTLIADHNKKINDLIKDTKTEKEKLTKDMYKFNFKKRILSKEQKGLDKQVSEELKKGFPTKLLEKLEDKIDSNYEKFAELDMKKTDIRRRIAQNKKRLDSLSSRKLSLGGGRRTKKRRLRVKM
tara:strand:- start:17 stop:457 length:441 start_codon:yes stop_codon:yes gene_type:complete